MSFGLINEKENKVFNFLTFVTNFIKGENNARNQFLSIFPEEDYRSIITRYNKHSSDITLNKTNKSLFNKNSARIGLVPIIITTHYFVFK